MKKRETKGVQSADFLVCFPSRSHLALLPKPICSPARPAESSNRQHNHPHHRHNHHQVHHPLKKSSTRGSPALWAKNKQMGAEISEPTSPKVTCAGQIKVRHKAAACKSWQSVMEEIERIHSHRKLKKKKSSAWVDSFGFKKDVMQFLTCLRNIKFDFRCFGNIPHSDIISSDDEEEDEEHDIEEEAEECQENEEDSRTVFSKWFMVFQENQNNEFYKENKKDNQDEDPSVAVPPPNALLLMRCRSAPAKSWLEEKQEEEDDQDQEEEEEGEENIKREEKKGKNLKALMEEEKTSIEKENSLVVMRYDTDFYRISTDIAKETWVVGGIKDPLSRSRSWKR
ncbi:uncharacterized protein LOC126666083 [Mercurialis annua]|uniref:uncharacterized protein LOC126666083 n=1 Tax=Mercurialis annua TaxID=3986 RepID=UPI00215ED650|nr:uncharacterized protein LOC126666083 [Mercurialis annua]